MSRAKEDGKEAAWSNNEMSGGALMGIRRSEVQSDWEYREVYLGEGLVGSIDLG